MRLRVVRSRALGATLAAALLIACGSSDEERAAARAEAIDVVESFGTRLAHVNLLVGDRAQLTNDIRDTYGPYVTTLLLGGWMSDLRSAPGRETSSPYPARIEVRETIPVGESAFDVTGDIVYVTNVDGDPVLRQPIRARVVRGPDDVWRISEFVKTAQ
ncbi:MAG TPA: hypothetical protein VF215_11360 [Thermoanaerobaculia bacterium]